MASIVKDEAGWNDTFCGPSRPEQIEKQFGIRIQDARNDMYQSGLDGLLVELSKLTRSD